MTDPTTPHAVPQSAGRREAALQTGPRELGRFARWMMNRKAVTLHAFTLALMIGVAVIISAGSIGYIQEADKIDITWEQRWAVCCWALLGAWWIVYFNQRKVGVANLRAFLDRVNPFRSTSPDTPNPQYDEANNTRIVSKATQSIGLTGIQIAVVALILNQVLNQNPNTLTHFQTFERPVILGIAIVTILLFALAIDIFDTSANMFVPSLKDEEHEYRQWFHRYVGPIQPKWGGPKGAVTYAYLGFALLSIFFVVALSYFYAALSGIGTAVYFYLAYPYLYGYEWATDARRPGEMRAVRCPEAGWVGLLMAIVILGLTIAAHSI